MKNVITLMLGLFLTTSAYADITGNIGYQNDYVFRGVNQTQSGGSLSTQVIVDSNGFYVCNVRGTKKVWSTNDMYEQRKCNIRNGAGYGFRYCYRDVNDKSTLEFWIIHYS